MLPQRELEKKNINYCLSSPLLPLSNLCLLLCRPFIVPATFSWLFFPFFFFWMGSPPRSIQDFIGIFFFFLVPYCQSKMTVFPHRQDCLYTEMKLINNWICHALKGIYNNTEATAKFKCQWWHSNNLELVLLVLFLHSIFVLHYISVCFMSPLSSFTPCCLALSLCLSLYFVFPLSPCVSRSFLWLQDYGAEGQSRCALDYEAEISLQSSCPAQFIKGGGGGGVRGRGRGRGWGGD